MKILPLSRSHRLLIFSFIISAGFLTVLSKNSPLYPMNDWVDVHCFFTLGRGILDGQVPYLDLYEQKGPVLYFLYALAALISRDTFWGVFLLETVTFGLFLYFSGKLAQLYLGESKVVYWIVALLAALLPITKAFCHGGSVEELCLFMLVYGLYSTARATKEKRTLTFREAFINGVFAAMTLWIKFTMTGFYIGLALYVLISYLLPKPQWKQLGITIGGFLAGIAAVSALVFAYFLWHGAADDLMTVYFYNNLTLYPVEIDTAETSRLTMFREIFKQITEKNKQVATLIGIGLLGLLADLRKNWRILLAVVLSLAGLYAGTYWGMRPYTYYAMIFGAFAVYGPIAVVRLLRLLRLNMLLRPLEPFRWLQNLAIAAVVMLLFSCSFTRSQNTYLMSYEKEDMPQYKFAQIINTVEDPKILNYGFLDAGFYYTTQTQPNCKFFCNFNINVPEMWSTQRELIENGEVDFIITRRYTIASYSPDTSAYTLVSTANMYFEGVEFVYYLYQKQ